MRKAPSRKRQYRLTLFVLVLTLAGCSTIAQRRRQSSLDQIDRIFVQCAEKHQRGELSGWTAEVRCGNESARQAIAGSNARYTEMVTVALEYRLQVARQMDAGKISEEEGKSRLEKTNGDIRALPGSFADLLSLTTDSAADS